MEPAAGGALPGWYPDPAGRHHSRYWNGERWTASVRGERGQFEDERGPRPLPIQVASARAIQRAVDATGGPMAYDPEAWLLDQPILIYSRLLSGDSSGPTYSIADQWGRQVGAARPVWRSVRAYPRTPERLRTSTVQILDVSGTVLLEVSRPPTVAAVRVTVVNGVGHTMAEFVKESVLGGRASVLRGDATIASLRATHRTHGRFEVSDHDGVEVASIARPGGVLSGNPLLGGGHRVVRLHYRLPEPLRSAVIAAPLALGLLQDPRVLV